MSLEELNGPILHLVLSIKEGHGFGFLQTPMVLVASTSGLCLETEHIQPCSDPMIRTDLAWETDKKSLRGFRTSNTPVKVECFSIKNGVKRDRIGYILLNIKSAQVVPNGKPIKLLEKCHHLLNLPQEAKLSKPELLLCLKITEANAPVSTCASSCSGQSRVLPESPQSGCAPSYSLPVPQDAPLIPVIRLENDLIQIGPEDSVTDTFIFMINVDKVGNISLLTPKKFEIPHDDAKSFRVTCGIFSTILTSKAINGELVNKNGSGDVRVADEHMQVKLLSSVPTIFRYFRENPSCTLQLHINGREIAATELHLTSLLRTEDRGKFVKEFNSTCSKSHRCIWISSFTASIPAAAPGVKPFIDVTTQLCFAGDKTVDRTDVKSRHVNTSHLHLQKQVFVENSSEWVENNPSFTTEASFCGKESLNDESQETVIRNNEANVRSSRPKSGVSIMSSDQDERFSSQIPSEFYPSCPGVRNIPFKSVNLLASDDSAEHKYILRVSLTNATFDRVPSSQRLRFRFEYQNGHVLTSSITDAVGLARCIPIELADIGSSIVLYASPSSMVTELRTGVVLVTVAEVKTDPSITSAFARASLPISCVCLPGKVESAVSAILEEDSSHMQLGIIHALLSLQDCGRRHVSSVRFQPLMSESHVPHSSSTPNLPHFVSSSEMTRAVEEIEKWKERQKELFTAELKEKEAVFLERADEMWMERKQQIEENFENNMGQCRSLADALSVAREELSRRSQICLEKEEEFKRLRDDLEKQYNAKFQELTLAAKRLDEGVKIKVMLTEAKCSDLEDRLKALTSENEKLRQEVEEEKDLRKKLLEKSTNMDEQSSGLNQQQVAKLLSQIKHLEEKLQISMKSKAYFKEQWGRVTREANLSRNSIARNSSLGYSLDVVEETMPSLEGKGLEQILLREEEELRQDSEALELLRRQIGDVCQRKIDV